MKHCKYCGEHRDAKEFRPNSLKCRVCTRADKKKWVEENWEAVNNSNKHYNKINAHIIKGNKLAKYWPGTTWQEATKNYNNILLKQKEVCALCGGKEKRIHAETGTVWDLAVDHCHETLKVRGLLCNACNRGLGLLGDKLEDVLKVLAYLGFKLSS